MGVWLNLAAKGRATLFPVCGEMCDVGFELLFNADSLKQISDDPRSNPLFDTLRSHISSSPSHLLSALPILMGEFITAMKKRRTLFSTGGSSTLDAHSSVAIFFSFCEDILRASGLPQTQVWRSRLDLLKVMEDKPFFTPGDENMVALLKEEVEASVECLASTGGEFLSQRCRACRSTSYQMRIFNRQYNASVYSPASTIALWRPLRVVFSRSFSPSFSLRVENPSPSRHMTSFLLPFRIMLRPVRCLCTYPA
jgi:hypothetical protein